MQATMPDTSWRYKDPTADEGSRTYAMFMHIVSALAAIDVSGVLVFIATLVMWRVRCKKSEFIDDHGREAVNFQISLYILGLAGVIAIVVFSVILAVLTLGAAAPVITIVATGVGVTGAAFLWLLRLIGTIRGAIAAGKGEIYRYPMSVRVIPEKA